MSTTSNSTLPLTCCQPRPVPALRAPKCLTGLADGSIPSKSSLTSPAGPNALNTLPQCSSGCRRLPPKRPPLPAQLLRADTLSSLSSGCQLLANPIEQQQQQTAGHHIWPSKGSAQAACANKEPIPSPLPSCGLAHSQRHPSAQTYHHSEQQPTALSPSKELLNSLKHSARMACCFCCCPVHRCVLWFCALELICSIYYWYSELSEFIRTYSTAELKDVLLLLLISGWLLTLCVSSVSVLLAHRTQDAQWVLPRLIQQSGLLILGFLFALISVVYFGGGAQAINNLLISIYERIFSDQIKREERQEVHETMRFYFLLGLGIDFFFIVYMASALCATKKYYRELQITGGRQFQRVNQHDASAPPPQPPMNPYYKGSYA